MTANLRGRIRRVIVGVVLFAEGILSRYRGPRRWGMTIELPTHRGTLHSTKVIAPLETRVIRFGLGSPEEPTFFIWRLWTQGNEIYLNFVPDKAPKISLHSSGNWQIDLGKKRHKLTGPIKCKDSLWTQGPSLFFVNLPHSIVPALKKMSDLAKVRRNVHWFDLPTEWHDSQFVVFISDPKVPRDKQPPYDAKAKFQHVIGPIPLRNGGHVWLRQATKKVPKESRDYLLQLRRKSRGFRATTSLHGMLLHFASENTITVIPFARRGRDEGTVLLKREL